MWSKTVESDVKLCRFAKRGSADGNIVPATDGSAVCYPVFGEIADADVVIKSGSTAAIATDEDGREIFLIAGTSINEGQYLMPDSNSAAIPATAGNNAGAQALEGAVAGQVFKVRPAQVLIPVTPSTPVGIAQGGTGAATASAARTALGLGSIATVAIVANQTASTATDAAGLKTDFNALLTKLKAAGIMTADS